MQYLAATIKLLARSPPHPSPFSQLPPSPSPFQLSPCLWATLLPFPIQPTNTQAFNGNPYRTDNEIRREQKSKPRCAMASRSAAEGQPGRQWPQLFPGKHPATMRPGSGTEEGPGSPGGAGGCRWNMHLIGYLSAFLGGYKVQPLPEGIMGCNNKTAGSFDASPLTEEL